MATVIDELDEIRAAFAAAIPCPQSIPQVVTALRTLLFAVVQPNAIPASNEAVIRLGNTIYAAGTAVADQVEPHMRSDAVSLGMGAATEAKQALIRAWVDHSALLAFELDALLRRRSIETRGDVFRRTIAIDRARAATSDGQPLH